MWKAAALLCTMLAVTACGKTSPVAPTPAASHQVTPADVLDTSDAVASPRDSDDHVEPPGVLPPG